MDEIRLRLHACHHHMRKNKNIELASSPSDNDDAQQKEQYTTRTLLYRALADWEPKQALN